MHMCALWHYDVFFLLFRSNNTSYFSNVFVCYPMHGICAMLCFLSLISVVHRECRHLCNNIYYFDVYFRWYSAGVLVECSWWNEVGFIDFDIALLVTCDVVFRKRKKFIHILWPEGHFGGLHLGHIDLNVYIYSNRAQRRSNLWRFGRLGSS